MYSHHRLGRSVGEPYRTWAEVQPSMFDGLDGPDGSTWINHGSMTTEREPMSERSIMGVDDHGSMTEVERTLEVRQSMR